ncbi:MAG: DEAD/DEAH box helicase family protein [Planctomycetes bacterium]|nr:DEAD/DEAH box helicase family protein [Planctomycetota bacterium]
MSAPFPEIRFTGTLRPSQAQVVEVARRQLAEGERRLHVVAPPGSGKTVVGLYLWATCIRAPALVLSPNSAIQAQWAAALKHFHLDGGHGDAASLDPQTPRLLTSLTYQAVTLPRRGGVDLNAYAVECWKGRLVEDGQAQDLVEAHVWIADLQLRNKDYHDERLGFYRKEVRDRAILDGDAMKMLHASSRQTLDRLKRAGIGLIVLDECHHLMGHWGRVLADAHEMLRAPVVLGLTATPPDRDGLLDEDVARYDAFFGPIDYDVPVPAVVKDGFLAPYQDLVHFVRPTPEELAYIANADEQLLALVEDLCHASSLKEAEKDAHRCAEPLHAWAARALGELRLPSGAAKDWDDFARRDPAFAEAAPRFLKARGIALPPGVPEPAELEENEECESDPLAMPVLVPVLDRYVRHRLRRSEDPRDHELAEKVIRRLRALGVQITERGPRACTSPAGRVMAYARAKALALLPILKAERAVLGDSLRAVVITDYERTSAVSGELAHLLDEEAGGAVAAFRTLLSDPETDALDPVLVTGSTVLVDDDLAPKIDAAARAWLAERKLAVTLDWLDERGFKVLNGGGAGWCPQVYVMLLTELFQAGLTKCLVGTRGLLGEGWDASMVNVLVDLTTVTTSMSVNQLRGRSFRLDPGDPKKLADNWDVVCIAPEFSKGLDDYRRFIAKHKVLYGITDDGAIEKGVGHVHASFTELRPEGLEGSMQVLNDEMLARTARRDHVRGLWRIGEPYKPEPVHAVELKDLKEKRGGGGFPPFARSAEPWSARSLTLAVGEALLDALVAAGLLKAKRPLHAGERAGGYVRVFLEEASPEENRLFSEALQEALGPLRDPRYIIPRSVDVVEQHWLSRYLPEFMGKYFEKRRREVVMYHAVPAVLARNKDLVKIYELHWNARVSPGEAVFAQRGEGEELLAQARRERLAPALRIHAKEVFL